MLVYYILKTFIIFHLFSEFGKNKINDVFGKGYLFYEEFQDNKDVCLLISNGVIDTAFRNMLNLEKEIFFSKANAIGD